MRAELLRQLQSTTPYDVIVVGGGATGAGAALDAAARGLSVALVESHDFGSGTSSRSTKLIHGGVRYLENAIKRLDRVEYDLVREGLEERQLFLRMAPHLARRLRLLTPCYRWWELPFYYIGLTLYDWIAGRRSLGRTTVLSPAQSMLHAPWLRRDGLKGCISYYDGEFNDARMNVALVQTAARHGACVANYVEVEALLKTDGRITGVAVRDRLTGAAFELQGRVVINATGPYIDRLRQLDNPAAETLVVPSAGTHIAVRTLPGTDGILVPKAPNGSVAFFKPFEGAMLIGTTEEKTELTYEPATTEKHIEYLRTLANQYLDARHQIGKDDILAVWTGIRPLVRDPAHSRDTVRLSRTHVVETSPSGLITIGGGKWTSFSRMAKDAVDAAISCGRLAAGPSRRETTRLVGAPHAGSAVVSTLVAEGTDAALAKHLFDQYGTEANQVLAAGATTPLAAGHPWIEAEVIYAVRQEYAVLPTDVLSRRTRLSFIDEGAARAALPRVVELMAAELGWSVDTAATHRLQNLI